MSTTSAGLGRFAKDRGSPITLSTVAVVLGTAAVVAAAARPVLYGAGTDVGWLRPVGYAGAVAALSAALGAYFVVTTKGVEGRLLSLMGIAFGAVALVTVTVSAAAIDGSLRLDRIVDRYFDLDLMRRVAPDVARGAVNTIRVTFLAEAFALLVGLIVATFKMSDRAILRWPASAYVNLVRGTPIVLLGTLVAFGLPRIGVTLGTFMIVGATLVINGSAYSAEIFRAGLQSVPRAQTDAARSLGMTRGAAMIFVVIPQAARSVIPPLMSDFIALIKDSAIVWAIAGFTVAQRDLFNAAQQGATSTFSPTPLVVGAIGYLLITLPLIAIVNRLEVRVRSGL